MRRLGKFLALAPADRRLAAEAAIWLTLARLMLTVLPFRWIAAGLGSLSPILPPASEPADRAVAPVDPVRQMRIRRIGRVVERVAGQLPWKAVCLPQALAARAMLARRDIAATVHFGMALSDEGLNDEAATAGGRRMLAHAWVTSGTTGVVGMPADGRFAVIARFTGETAPSPPQ